MRLTHKSEPHTEEQRLLERWLERGDRAAREELVRRLLPLARLLARRYDGMGDSFEDLVQVAAIGVVKAVDPGTTPGEAHRCGCMPS